MPWLWHGAALAALPWMHTRFAVLAATLGGLVLVRLAKTSNPFGKAAAFLAIPTVSALGWLMFFVVVYGTPDPSAPYGNDVGSSFMFFPNGAGGLFFDQGFGVFATAPVLAVAFAGFLRTRRLGIEWLVVAVPYLLATATYPMWWAGMSGPARFLVALLLPLALPAACAWATSRARGARTVMLAALIVTIWLSAVMAGAGGGRLGYHARNEAGTTAAPWMEWANHVVDLPAAFPAFVPLPVGTPIGARTAATQSGVLATLPWVVCLGVAAWFLARLIDRRHLRREAAIAAAAVTFGSAVMAAMSMVWTVRAADPITTVPAQMEALLRIASTRVLALDLIKHRRLSAAAAAAMPIDVLIRPLLRAGSRALHRPVAAFPVLPPGSYLLSAKRHGRGDGWVMAGLGNDQFAIVTQPIAAFDTGVRLDLPVGVRRLSVRADEGARDQLDSIVLRPVTLVAPLSPSLARRAVRYADGVAFFLDDRAFPEPSGFWVGGRRDTTIVFAPDRPAQSQPFVLRNAPVDNTVTLESGAWRESLALKAGEERRVEIPVDASRGGVFLRIACSSGFRPSEHNPDHRDGRFLGVFIRSQ